MGDQPLKEEPVQPATRANPNLFSIAASIAHMGLWQYHLESGLYEFDDDFYAIYATNTAREGAFMPTQEYLRRFVYPEDLPAVKAVIARMMDNRDDLFRYKFDHRIIRRDGVVRTILVSIHYDSQAKRWYGVNQDITERKAMEEALQNSRDTLALAAELASLGPWKYHPEQGLFEFSDEFYAIFGTTVAQEGRFKTVQEFIAEFIHPGDWGIFEETEIKKNYVHRILRRDGEERIVAVQGHIVKDDTGKITHWFGATQDITEYKRAEAALVAQAEQIRQIAYTDALTGLASRTHLNEWFEAEMMKARTGTAAGYLLFIDLDDLKTVNDTLGHSYGDAIIYETANRIKRLFSAADFIARFGGDEFLVVVPDRCERQEIANIAERLIQSLREEIAVLGEVFRLSASMGIALYPEDGSTAEELIKNVDNAMHYAKNAGKNGWRFYDLQMQKTAYAKMLLIQKLHRALEHKEFELHYQPQYRIGTEQVVGFEALIRWRSQDEGLIPPDQFIPAAEQGGLVRSIGSWVLREACGFARRLAESGWGSLFVAVNVSPHQLSSESFIDSVREAIAEAGIEAGQLEIEITENALIASLKEAISRLEELKAMGVRLALDDFGTGYSSLTYLQQLPVQTLKIDRSFIGMIQEDSVRKPIIGTIIDLAHQMEMTVVAEGVETGTQLTYLQNSRCDFAQGFLLGRPVPEPEAIQFLVADSQKEVG